MTDYEKKNIIDTLSDNEIEMIKDYRKEVEKQAEEKRIFDDLRYDLLTALQNILQEASANVVFTFEDVKGVISYGYLTDLVRLDLSYKDIVRTIEI